MSFLTQRSKGTVAAIFGCITLLAGSIVSFQQQIPNVPQTSEIYDSKLVAALRNVQQLVPEGQKICVSSNSPQATYFTNRFAQIPWNVDSEKSLLQYMLLRDYSYLLVYENKSSESKLYGLFAEKGAPKLERYFEKISSQITDSTQLDLYHIRSNITLQGLSRIFDHQLPIIRILSPANSTIFKANQSGVALINVTGITQDLDSGISKVELKVSSKASPLLSSSSSSSSLYNLAKPFKAQDWSRWSYSTVATPGIVTIWVKATDNAGNVQWQKITIEIIADQNGGNSYSHGSASVNPVNGTNSGNEKEYVIPSTTPKRQDSESNQVSGLERGDN